MTKQTVHKRVSSKGKPFVAGSRPSRIRQLRDSYGNLVNNPMPTINKLEETRKGLVEAQNFLGSIRNIGRTEAEGRTEKITYVPHTLTINPFEAGKEKEEASLIGEVFILSTEKGAKIQYEAKDALDQRSTTDTEFVQKKNSILMATEIGDIIDDIYKRFRAKTLAGRFFIIVDSQYRTLYDSIEQRFQTEINADNIRMVDSIEHYYEYESINKYVYNEVFEIMLKRLAGYQAYIEFDKYQSEGGKQPFEKWKYETELDSQPFWTEVGQSRQSYIQLDTKGLKFTTWFGIIRGMPGLIKYKEEGRALTETIPFQRDLGYEKYQELKRTISDIRVANVTIPPVMAALAYAVLESFRLYEYNGKIIFESTRLPDIGFAYQGG